nr:putative mitochondrial 40S ribosomal protein [Aspergillus niger]
MVFILGVNFPERNLKSLESFFGIGNLTSTRLLARFHIHPTCKVGDLANKQVLDITAALSDMKIENDLRRQYLDNIKRLKETGTYRGRRHALGLPVRGQRTRSQIKTAVKLNRMERRLEVNMIDSIIDPQWSCGFVSIGAWNGVINSLL